MEQKKIDRLIERVEFVYKNSELHFNKANAVDSTVSFFMGIHSAFAALSSLHELWLNSRRKIFENRGHSWSARGVWKELAEKGFNEDEIVKELFEIEIETLKLLKNNLEK